MTPTKRVLHTRASQFRRFAFASPSAVEPVIARRGIDDDFSHKPLNHIAHDAANSLCRLRLWVHVGSSSADARQSLSIEKGRGCALYWLGLPGPTLAAVAVACASGSTNQLARGILHWPIGIQWWLLAIFTIPAIYLAGTGIHSWRQVARPTGIFRRPRQRWLALLMGQLYVVSSEEVGWRGFALPLLVRMLGSVGGTVAVGLVWALWHLPMFQVPTSHQKGAFWHYAHSLIAWSAIMTVLVSGSGSILPAMAFHAAANISSFVMDVPPEAERYITVLLGLVSLLLIPLLPSPLLTINP